MQPIDELESAVSAIAGQQPVNLVDFAEAKSHVHKVFALLQPRLSGLVIPSAEVFSTVIKPAFRVYPLDIPVVFKNERVDIEDFEYALDSADFGRSPMKVHIVVVYLDNKVVVYYFM